MDEVEKLWLLGLQRGGARNQRPRPAKGMSSVLVALHELGESHGGQIARRAGQQKSNVTAMYLPKLEGMGFVELVGEMPGLGHRGGGRPAHIWRLTRLGAELAGLLAGEAA